MNRFHLSVPLALLGCGSERSAEAPMEEAADRFVEMQVEAKKEARLEKPSAPAAPAATEGGGGMGELMATVGGRGGAVAEQQPKGAAAPEPEAAATRAWFPETFLFEPLVVTDERGQASVDARVPDRLTSWRVLALANSREGGLAGAVTSFLGTLPVYVDPIVPPILRAGDRVVLPVQVVNTTEEARSARLTVTLGGAAAGAGGGSVRLPANGSAVVLVPVEAREAGTATLKAALEGADAVQRSFQVLPSGRPEEVAKGGTLAAARELRLSGPVGLDPRTARARLVVYPGALALLRAELGQALGRGGVAEDAYALLLAGQGPGLLRALGEEPDAEEARKNAILAGQRAMRRTLAPDLPTAALYAEAALAHPENPVMTRLADRLLDTLAAEQRPDGTFGGASGWTAQRLLVATADASAAVRAGAIRGKAGEQRAARVSLRAGAAFERLAGQIQDPCTAAAVLVSGAAPERLAAKLREQVREAVIQREDGARALPAPDGALRADGRPFTETECTALAALALKGDAETPWVADLGAALLGAYAPGWGWGDGRTNQLSLRAVLALFQEPIPESVRIELRMDGRPVLEGRLDGDRRKEVVVLEAPAGDAGGEHTWTVTATPAVPGLGYQLALRSWGPWPEETEEGGSRIELLVPDDLAVGAASELLVRALAPAGSPLAARLPLPAGLQVDDAALAALAAEGRIERWDAEDGLLTLELPALQSGQIAELRLRVIPTLSGTLQSGAATLALAGPGGAVLDTQPPLAWRVR